MLDGYFNITTQGTSAEPPGFGQKLGLDYLKIPGTNGPSGNYTGWPYFNVSGYSTIGTAVNSSGGPLFYNDKQFQYAANGPWSREKHNIRFGAEVSRQQFNHFENANGFNGQFAFAGGPASLKGGAASNQFNNYASFLLGLPTTVYHDLLPFGNLVSHQSIYGIYVQDQWRASALMLSTLRQRDPGFLDLLVRRRSSRQWRVRPTHRSRKPRGSRKCGIDSL